MFNLVVVDDKSAYEAFKEIFTKYFKSYDIQPRSALGIEEITVYNTTGEVLAAWEKEAREVGIEFAPDVK